MKCPVCFNFPLYANWSTPRPNKVKTVKCEKCNTVITIEIDRAEDLFRRGML